MLGLRIGWLEHSRLWVSTWVEGPGAWFSRAVKKTAPMENNHPLSLGHTQETAAFFPSKICFVSCQGLFHQVTVSQLQDYSLLFSQLPLPVKWHVYFQSTFLHTVCKDLLSHVRKKINSSQNGQYFKEWIQTLQEVTCLIQSLHHLELSNSILVCFEGLILGIFRHKDAPGCIWALVEYTPMWKDVLGLKLPEQSQWQMNECGRITFWTWSAHIQPWGKTNGVFVLLEVGQQQPAHLLPKHGLCGYSIEFLNLVKSQYLKSEIVLPLS